MPQKSGHLWAQLHAFSTSQNAYFHHFNTTQVTVSAHELQDQSPQQVHIYSWLTSRLFKPTLLVAFRVVSGLDCPSLGLQITTLYLLIYVTSLHQAPNIQVPSGYQPVYNMYSLSVPVRSTSVMATSVQFCHVQFCPSSFVMSSVVHPVLSCPVLSCSVLSCSVRSI